MRENLYKTSTFENLMRILFTGASSFTGMWFVKALEKTGHEVVAPLKNAESTYEGLRKTRISELSDVRYSTPYGSKEFDALIQNESFDLFCHHAADVTNYKSPDFDSVSALKNNVGNISTVLNKLQEKGCNRILLTGSVFEQNEGAGSDQLRAVSPYGLSKGLTSEVFKYYADIKGISLAKFVIPNPFGPFEEFRFTSFLVKNWLEEKEVNVSHPSYERDNIHVSLLAMAYEHFASKIPETKGFLKFNPSGYRESQGAFTARFAKEMRSRLKLPCAFTLSKQTDFSEPKVRLNTDLLNLKWDEKTAWDELATYYETIYTKALIS